MRRCALTPTTRLAPSPLPAASDSSTLALLSIPKSFSFSAAVAAIDSLCDRFLTQLLHTKKARTDATRSPPSDAPAMAPAGTLPLGDLMSLQTSSGQSTHVCWVSSHLSFSAQLQTPGEGQFWAHP